MGFDGECPSLSYPVEPGPGNLFDVIYDSRGHISSISCSSELCRADEAKLYFGVAIVAHGKTV